MIAVALFMVWAVLVLVCFAKQRFVHGLAGMVIPLLAIYAAVRLAKPASYWARRFYGAQRPDKQAKAELRFRHDRRTEQLKKWVRDLSAVPRATSTEPKFWPGDRVRSEITPTPGVR
jgi:hypothetical protein